MRSTSCSRTALGEVQRDRVPQRLLAGRCSPMRASRTRRGALPARKPGRRTSRAILRNAWSMSRSNSASSIVTDSLTLLPSRVSTELFTGLPGSATRRLYAFGVGVKSLGQRLRASVDELERTRLIARFDGLGITQLGDVVPRTPVRVGGEISRGRHRAAQRRPGARGDDLRRHRHDHGDLQRPAQHHRHRARPRRDLRRASPSPSATAASSSTRRTPSSPPPPPSNARHWPRRPEIGHWCPVRATCCSWPSLPAHRRHPGGVMMNRREVLELFGRQYGVATTSQLVDRGVSARTVSRARRDGLLVPLTVHVARAVDQPDTFESRAMAAQLHLGDEAMSTATTAGALLGLRSMPRTRHRGGARRTLTSLLPALDRDPRRPRTRPTRRRSPGRRPVRRPALPDAPRPGGLVQRSPVPAGGGGRAGS